MACPRVGIATDPEDEASVILYIDEKTTNPTGSDPGQPHFSPMIPVYGCDPASPASRRSGRILGSSFSAGPDDPVRRSSRGGSEQLSTRGLPRGRRGRGTTARGRPLRSSRRPTRPRRCPEPAHRQGDEFMSQQANGVILLQDRFSLNRSTNLAGIAGERSAWGMIPAPTRDPGAPASGSSRPAGTPPRLAMMSRPEE
jgi:hypothetical protein